MNTATASNARAIHSLPTLALAAAETVSRLSIAGRGALGFLSERDLDVLMRWSTIRSLPRRQVVVRQGDPANAVILALDGFLKVTTVLSDGREVLLEVIGPDGCFGEMAALNRSTHDADVTTLSRCRLMMIDARRFRHTLEQRPDGLLSIMRLVTERLRKMTERMADTLILPAPARLAKVLTELSRLRSQVFHDGGGARPRLLQSELGAMAGLTRESVNRYLGIWREAGWIVVSDGSVTVLDAEALSNLLPEPDRSRF